MDSREPRTAAWLRHSGDLLVGGTSEAMMERAFNAGYDEAARAASEQVAALREALERTVYGVRKLGYEPDAETERLLASPAPSLAREPEADR